jgi:FMN phosphatase YigB (HAD superfamily)
MIRKLILVDVDNTLYDWPAFFAPSFRAMVHALKRELGLPEEQLYSEFRAVFAKWQSLEYAFAIQALESVRDLSTERIQHLIRQGRGAFLRVQRTRLRPYGSVTETLGWLLEQGHVVVGVTNSPIFLAQKRLYDLGLDSLLTGLVAWEGFEPETDPSNAGFVPLSRKRGKTRFKKLVAVPISDCKPNKKHYEIALATFGGRPDDAWAVGDSLLKDLEPASRLGIRTIWARYGADHDPAEKDASTLLKITHWSKSEISRAYDKTAFEPDHTIDSFEELKKIVPATVWTLF